MMVEVPMRLPSLANSRGHSRARGRVVSRQRAQVTSALEEELGAPPPPNRVSVELVRVAPRRLDDDNLRGALKGVRDAVTEWLGYPNDDHENLRFFYGQERASRPRYQACRVTIADGHHNCSACGSELAGC